MWDIETGKKEIEIEKLLYKISKITNNNNNNENSVFELDLGIISIVPKLLIGKRRPPETCTYAGLLSISVRQFFFCI